MRVRKGDLVQVRSGKHKGKRGHVMVAIPNESKVIVDGANMAKRHAKPRGSTMQGGIIDKDMPLPVSAVSIVCPSCGPTRIAVHTEESTGRKFRACRKCGSEFG